MDVIIYLLLDCLDTMAIVFLMMSVFQYPIKEYGKEISIICGLLAAISYIIREVIHFAAIDPVVHIVLLIICLRYIVKIKWHRSIIIAAVGIAGYFAVQAIVSVIFSHLGWLSSVGLSETSSSEVRLVQLSSQCSAFFIAVLIHKYDLGKTKFIRPPHDFYITIKLNEEQIRMFSVSVLSLVLLGITSYSFVFSFSVIAFSVLATVLCLAITYLTYRREKIGSRS